ncbi:glycosyltransferase [Streptacidiphilus sp. P02-A3a]|uniref:glycosyltransferase family 2 protein n=1 Tax=Streptacidiphilus sp. P02-A3a TaxID=2704468 RepID=UPI001CDC353B|nr:glycosyltransferase family 2 protein [Streptacidiphilus sp. P02-A3a]
MNLSFRCRALGTAHALASVRARHPELTDARVWLAHTDADSRVPESWLADQLAHATAGAHAVVGQVQVRDWGEHTATTTAHFKRHYFVHHHDRRTPVASTPAPGRSGPRRPHPHVHGANLGVRADAYLAVGGFPQLPVGEDRALVTALEQAHYRVLAATDAPVVTSARRDPRAPGGFGHFLLDLETRTTQSQD